MFFQNRSIDTPRKKRARKWELIAIYLEPSNMSQPSEVQKKTGEILLSAKAWNGRIITSWLAATMVEVSPMVPEDACDGRFQLATHAAILRYD